MKKYSKAVREMYSQFNQGEAHPMEKYIGGLANYAGEQLEVVGYTTWPDGSFSLIVDASQNRRPVSAGVFRRGIQRVRVLLAC